MPRRRRLGTRRRRFFVACGGESKAGCAAWVQRLVDQADLPVFRTFGHAAAATPWGLSKPLYRSCRRGESVVEGMQATQFFWMLIDAMPIRVAPLVPINSSVQTIFTRSGRGPLRMPCSSSTSTDASNCSPHFGVGSSATAKPFAGIPKGNDGGRISREIRSVRRRSRRIGRARTSCISCCDQVAGLSIRVAGSRQALGQRVSRDACHPFIHCRQLHSTRPASEVRTVRLPAHRDHVSCDFPWGIPGWQRETDVLHP